MNTRYLLSWYCVLVPLLVSAELIDDFSTPNLNNIGGIRSGLGANVILTYPRSGIAIPHKDDFLIESVIPDGFRFNLTNMSLRISYTAFSSGNRLIRYFQPSFEELNAQVMPHQFSIPLMHGRQQFDIPLSSIASADMTRAHVFGIGGPLFVHRLDLVDTNATDVTIESLGPGPKSFLNSYTLRITESTPNLAFVHYSTELNWNHLNLRRDGLAIRRVQNGIEIMQGGLVYENLVPRSDTIDLSRTRLRITYSATVRALVSINLWYHAGSGHFGAELASTIERNVPDGRNRILDVPFTQFPRFRPLDAKSIWISGLITLHSIKLIHQNGAFPCMEISSGWFRNTVLVDDMWTWPAEPFAFNRMVIDRAEVYSDSGELVDPNNSHGVGRNNLNQPCTGEGVLLAESGVKLSHHGSIYEQLSSRNKIYNLSHTRIEIEYSAEREVTRQLNVMSVHPNDEDSKFHVRPIVFNVTFTEGHRHSVHVNIGVCGPSNAFRISGQGEVTLHHIRFHTSVRGEPDDALTTIIVDDFIDWPLLDNLPGHRLTAFHLIPYIPSAIPQTIEMSNYTIFDYRQDSIHNIPAFRNCEPVIGHGVDIKVNGYMYQLLPSNIGKNIKITYTSSFVGTRRIVFTTNHKPDSHTGHFLERTRHVVFNSGQFQEVAFCVNDFTLIAIRIHGPLVVHQVEYSKAPCVSDSSPVQNVAYALLIDDFFNGDQRNSNILNGERYTTGTSNRNSIALRSFGEYLVEGFEGEWSLSNLAFQITYTASQTLSCKMMLITELKGDHDWYGPYLESAPEFENIVLNKGTRKEIFVPATSLMRTYGGRPTPVYGIAIHGPNGGAPLSVHRIELTGWVKGRYYDSMKPTTPHLRISKIVTGHERKLAEFRRQLASLRIDGTFRIPISRVQVWRDVCQVIETDPENLRKSLHVDFTGERGVQGLASEFFALLGNAISSPSRGLFITSKQVHYALQINPKSEIYGSIYLSHYRMVGRIIGMAILNQELLHVRLAPSLYNKLIEEPRLGQDELPEVLQQDDSPIDISGIGDFDRDLHTRLTWYLQNDIGSVPEMTMAIEWDNNGKTEIVDLVKNGRLHKVTESNKRQYVRECVVWHTVRKLARQADALRDGVWDLVPQSILSVFNETELESLIAGPPSFADWVTEYV